MSRKSKAPEPVKTPYESTSTSEVIETPDIAAFRAYSPNLSMLAPALDAQFESARRRVTDNYGAYTGIPSHVARNRMRDEALSDLESSRASAMAEGDEANKRIKMAQLESLANLTAKRQQQGSGFNTQLYQQPQGSGWLGSAISGGAGIAAAFA